MESLNLGRMAAVVSAPQSITLSGPSEIVGGAFSAVSDGVSSVGIMIDIDTQGHDLTIDGVEFDGNNQAPQLLRISNTSNFDGTIKIVNCEFKNVRRRAAIDGQGAADAVQIRGGFERVIITDCTVKNVTREADAGAPGSTGSTGIAVFQDRTNGMKYARSVTLRGCNFDTIDTDDTGAARVDCDGFKYFSGEAFEGASEFFPTHFEATGNRFKDCAGRAIKGQCTHGVVTNNTVIRSGVLPIHGFWSDINMQMGGGTICNNDAVYSPVDGASPFTHDGSAGANGALVSFYHAPQSGRQAGAPIVTGNTIRNNVPEALGTLAALVNFHRGSVDENHLYHVTSRDNKVIGGAADVIAILPYAGADDPPVFAVVCGCLATKLTGGLCGVSGGSAPGVRLTATANSQAGADVDIVHNRSGGGSASVHLNAFGNHGFTS